MKRIMYDQYGGVDVLKLDEAPVPRVDKDTLLVRIKAASINPLDWKIRNGEMKILTGFSFPKSVGIDFSGVIDDVGSGVTSFQKGDEVMGITDIFKGGALAEYAVVKADNVTRKPATISFEQAAALPVVGASTMQIFDKLAPLQAGMDVLVNGATGGIGLIATQVAKKLGARVTAVVSTKGVELAKTVGSDVVVNYEQENVLDQSILYDVILDFSGKLTFDKAEEIMKPISVHVSTLPSPTELVSSFVHDLFSTKKREILNLKPSHVYLDKIAAYTTDGLAIVVSQTYPMTAFKQAYTEAAKGGIMGKIVFTI